MEKRISELNQTFELKDGCCFPIVQDGETKKVTFETIQKQIESYKLISIEKSFNLGAKDRQADITPSMFGLDKFDEDCILQANANAWNRLCFIHSITTDKAVLRVFNVSASSSGVLTLSNETITVRVSYLGK